MTLRPHRVFLSAILVSLIIIVSAEYEWNETLQQFALKYSREISRLEKLLKERIDKDDSAKINSTLEEGQRIFQSAIDAFPDETLPHAHEFLAKLHYKVGSYESAILLYDEAIRRSELPGSYDPNEGSDAEEARQLREELKGDRERAQYLMLQRKLDEWTAANEGGITKDTTPLEPIALLEGQLNVFPQNPQSLYDKAKYTVLSLDSPKDEDGDPSSRNDLSWEAHNLFDEAQYAAYIAYTYGKMRGLAGGRQCLHKYKANDRVLMGGKLWIQMASNVTLIARESQVETKLHIGAITLEYVLLSGRDAVISGYAGQCQVYVPHPYVNLADNLPMIASWEAIDTTTILAPAGNRRAYDGKLSRSLHGLPEYEIPTPEGYNVFQSIVLLTGYKSTNYFHFVAETLPSIISLKESIDATLDSDNDKEIMITPNLQHGFVDGFLRLLIPDAFKKNKVSDKIIQWGPNIRPVFDDDGEEVIGEGFLSTHPIALGRRLDVVTWDQPNTAPAPTEGPPYCLTPPPLLNVTRHELWKKVGAKETTDNAPRIVYCKGKLVEEEEKQLLLELKGVTESTGAKLFVYSLPSGENETSSKSNLKEVRKTVKLFHSATVVVGAHGEALVNSIFSRPGTTVIEMGFESVPQASQYRHLSTSLGLKHVDINLTKDSRSFGAAEYMLREGGLEDVVEAVLDGLRDAAENEGGDRAAVKDEVGAAQEGAAQEGAAVQEEAGVHSEL